MAAYDSRYWLIQRKETGKDPLVDQILQDPSSVPYSDCLEIFASKTKRSYLEACLMTQASLEEIALILELPLDTLDLYTKVFFDVRNMDTLSKLEVIEKTVNQDDRTLKIWAVSEGLGFIAWRLGRATSLSPTNSLQGLFNMCIFKAKEGFFNPNSAKSSIEATKWAKLAMDLGKLIKSWVHDGKEAKRDLELAIKEVVPDFPGFDELG